MLQKMCLNNYVSAKKVIFPRRAPSVEIPKRQPVYITPDKTTCAECPCYPKELPYNKRGKLLPCIKNPLTLYELAANMTDRLLLPLALYWTVDEVAWWISEGVGLPHYKACIQENNINGMRLLLLADPSHLPDINIHDYDHIKLIVTEVYKLFAVEFITFARSIGLPPRKLATTYTHFKAKSGPRWGIRQNYTRCDVLRWLKILDPAPVHLDHWDLVWYQKPDFPRTLFGRVDKYKSPRFDLPHYRPPQIEPCMELQIKRKFKLDKTIPSKEQFIWIEITPECRHPPVPKIEIKPKKESRLFPKYVSLEGLTGKDFVLARRLKPKEKFDRFSKQKNWKKCS